MNLLFKGPNKIKSEVFLISLISLLFFVYNLLISSKGVLPWIDEVMLTDSPANLYLQGKWYTTAWYASYEKTPFSTYLPLYQFLLFFWFKLFGFSLWTSRSLNLVLVFAFLLTIYHFLRSIGYLKKNLSILLLLFLFWISGDFSQLYLQGRPDLLTALVFSWVLMSFFYVVKNNRRKLVLVLLSSLLFISGIQGVVYFVWVIIFSIFYFYSYRKAILKASVFVFIGTLLGFFLVSLFMLYHGHLISFFISFIAYSATLKSAAVLFLPIVAPLLGINANEWIAKVANDPTGVGFLERVMSGYLVNDDYVIIQLTSLIIFVIAIAYLRKKPSRTLLSLFLVSLFMPFLMSLSGRYVHYYTWMSFVPAAIFLICFVEELDNKIIRYIGVLPVCFFVYTGLFAKTYKKESSHIQIQQFVQKQNIDSSDLVVSPFFAFYDIKLKTQNAYFLGIFPLNRLPRRPDYIITSNEINEFGNEHISSALKKMQADTLIKVELIDSLLYPDIKVYKISSKHPNNK